MKQTHKKIIVCLLLAALMLLPGCGNSREYLEDITVQLEETDSQIVIKEWRWLMGSGAEIYALQDGELTLLGITTGGDDGYCPFASGTYTIEAENDFVFLSRAFWQSAPRPFVAFLLSGVCLVILFLW